MSNVERDAGAPTTARAPASTSNDASARASGARRSSLLAFGVLAGLSVLALAPIFLDDYLISLLTEVLILAILTSGLNLLLGYTGLVSLGHAAFLGVGAYATAILTVLLDQPVWMGMVAAVVFGFLTAYLVGLLCVRTKGVQFLLITLAFGQMFFAVAEKTRITGGDDGMTGIPRLDTPLPFFEGDADRAFYVVVLIFFCLSLALLRILVASPFGRCLVGIRENEKRMTALGYRTQPYKALAFGLSGMLAALAGSLWVQHSFFVNPHLMTWQMSGEALLMVIIGGSQSFFGPLFGAAFYVFAKDFLADLTDAYIMFFGLLFVLVVAFFRGGLVGGAQRLFDRLGPSRNDGDGPR